MPVFELLAFLIKSMRLCVNAFSKTLLRAITLLATPVQISLRVYLRYGTVRYVYLWTRAADCKSP